MASDTLHEIFLAGKDVLHLAYQDIKVEPFKTKNVTITINDSYWAVQLVPSNLLPLKTWTPCIYQRKQRCTIWYIQFNRASKTVSYSAIYSTADLIAHYKAACEWIRTTYLTVRPAATEAVSTLLARCPYLSDPYLWGRETELHVFKCCLPQGMGYAIRGALGLYIGGWVEISVYWKKYRHRPTLFVSQKRACKLAQV